MTTLVTTVFGFGTVLLDILIVLGFAALLARKSWGRGVVDWVGSHAVPLGFLLSLLALVGSLIYSNIIGYAPCELCWWQRICLYPLVVIFAVSLTHKARDAYAYATHLAVIAALIALYHTYIQLGGSGSLLPCTAVGGACSKVYVLTLGYVTIPTMSLTVALAVILLGVIKKSYDQNRHA